MSLVPQKARRIRRGWGSERAAEQRPEVRRDGIMIGTANFRGSMPALATPFKDGAFHHYAFRKLVNWQI